MILKIVWMLFVFLLIVGFLFVGSFGVGIQDACYEKSETLVAEC